MMDSQQIVLSSNATLTINYTATLGDLLVATLLTGLIVILVTMWVAKLISGSGRHV